MNKIKVIFVICVVSIINIMSISEGIASELYNNVFLTSSYTHLKYITQDNALRAIRQEHTVNGGLVSEEQLLFYEDVQSLSQSTYRSEIEYFIKTDGTLWEYTIEKDKINKTKIDGLNNCIKVCNGRDYTLVVLSDGTVWSWGTNRYGQLGHGNNEDCNLPKKIDMLSNIVDISTNDYFVIALDDVGNVYTWGSNASGQIGNGNYTSTYDNTNFDMNVPYKVEQLPKCVQIGASNGRATALTQDGKIYVWGKYTMNPAAGFFEPTLLNGIPDCIQISASDSLVLALTSDGEVWQWGYTRVILDGTGGKPMKTAHFEKPIKVVAGNVDTIICEDNTIWQGSYDEENYLNMVSICTVDKDNKYPIKSEFNSVYTPSKWAVDEVYTAENLGIKLNDTKYEFKISRLDFCKLLMRMVELKPDIAGINKDNEIVYNDTEDEDVILATSYGIVNGRGVDSFEPYSYITRQEAATMLCRTAKILGYEITNGKDIIFEDKNNIADWSISAVDYICSSIDNSNSKYVMEYENNFLPNENMTVQEAIISAKRLLNVE